MARETPPGEVSDACDLNARLCVALFWWILVVRVSRHMSLRYSTNVETLPTAVPFERCAYSVGFHRILFFCFVLFLNAVCVSLPLQKLTTLKPTITRRSSETLIGGLQGPSVLLWSVPASTGSSEPRSRAFARVRREIRAEFTACSAKSAQNSASDELAKGWNEANRCCNEVSTCAYVCWILNGKRMKYTYPWAHTTDERCVRALNLPRAL